MGEAKLSNYGRSCNGISFLCAQLDADRKARVRVDWALIEEEYSDAIIDRAGDKDELSE